jgi:DNA-binding NtrC family response regulator/tetratricopeptide (TPR) repeat protein
MVRTPAEAGKLPGEMADLGELAGESPAIEAVRHELRRLLSLARERRRLPAILIQGETGTGKGLVAKLLHRLGPRARGPFVDLNCAAIPETLLEGELFGYEQGAFTDARRAKAGLFQTSSGGVLFLDEIALLSPGLQAKLLTALEERAVRRIGSTTKETFDSWVISATNTDLDRSVRERQFREDLYHRLAVVTVRLPPLRERGRDAALLAQRFLERACREYGLPVKSLAPDAQALVARDPWPGNVRELTNVMERLALLVDGRDVTAADVAVARGTDRSLAGPEAAAGSEREQLLAALEATGGNITRTALRLGISRNTVRARLERHGLRTRKEPDTIEPAELAPELPPEAAASAAPAFMAAQWERRHVTLLRIAVTGTAEDSRDAALLLSLAADKIVGFGGRVEALRQASLDGSFGVAPVDNAARRAVSAALAVHTAVAQAARPGLAATTVVHTEQATIGQVADQVLIDEAQRPTLGRLLDRLLEGAEPGRVYISAQAAAFVERHFELHGDNHIDPALASTFTVVRRDPTGLGAWRRLTRFVDRQAELNLLESRWDLARRGRGQIVALVGEPGTGKSRLLLEFLKARDPLDALVLHVTMSATEDSSRPRPAASLLRSLFAIGPADGHDEIVERLAARLRTLNLEPALLAPLAGLLDTQVDDAAWTPLDSRQRARRMLDALRNLLVCESQARPVIMALEDLHWIDADTQAALDQLVDVVPTARILLVVAYRPEYRHAWASKSFYTQLRVDCLPASAAEELLADLLGGGANPSPLREQLLDWTEGNPFFIEEGVRTLAETGALAGTAGSYRAVREVADHALPATVEDTLAARIHRLPAITRHVLQCGAVIGADFRRTFLAALAGLPEDRLSESLHVLEEAEFVYAAAGGPEPAYTFKHALTHLVAYRSVPPERQRALHAQAQRTLEVLYAGQLEAHADALAEHAFRGEVWERAATYCHMAGTRALARSATRTAVDRLQRALAALDQAEPQRDLRVRAIDVRLDLRYALALLGHHERTLPYLREAEAIAVELDDPRRLGRIGSFLANGLYNLGDHAGALASAGRAREIGERLGDFATRVTADIYAGRALHVLGRFHEATRLFQTVVDALAGERANEYAGLPVLPAAYARSYLGMGLAELGEFTAALDVVRDALGIAEATAGPDTIQWACYALGLIALDRGDVDAAIPPLERALSICRSAELPVYVPRALAALGHAYTLGGRPDGLSMLEAAAAHCEAPTHRNIQARVLTRLADGCVLTGNGRQGAEHAERAVALARQHGERGSEVHALRELAAAYAAGSRTEEAVATYAACLALADELGMRPEAAQCHLGLGRLDRIDGRLASARRHLDAAHDAFGLLGMTRRQAEAATERALAR